MHDKQGSMACRAQDDDEYTYSKNSFFSDSVMPFPAVFRLFYYIHFQYFRRWWNRRYFLEGKKPFRNDEFHVQKWGDILCALPAREIPRPAFVHWDFYPFCSLKKIQSFQGDLLEQDTSKGIIMSTQSLVLQHIEVDAVGTYTCRAVNSEGTGESNPVPLKIMCKFHR